jgi:hypothetical protein
MKKMGVVLAIFAIVALIGCGSGTTGGAAKGDGAPAAEPFKVDLTKLTQVVPEKPKKLEDVLKGQYKTAPGVKNTIAFSGNYDDLLILIPESALPPDMSKYTRCTITANHFNKAGAEIKPDFGNGMVSLVIDIKGNIRTDGNPNLALKEFNLGRDSISTDRGVRLMSKQPPQGVLIQNSNTNVAFIELTGLIFHNGNYSSQ